MIAVRGLLSTVTLAASMLAAAGSAADAQTPPPAAAPVEFPPKGWPEPVMERPYTFVLADVVDFRSPGADVRWDTNGWHGGDINRLWFKSEGEQNLRKAERNLNLQVLYGRFVRKFYDVQVGGGVQTATYQDRNVTRAELVLGVEGFVPFKSDFESLLFISYNGDVRGRVTYERDLRISQRLVLQPRGETNLAAQQVQEFGVGSGLNDIELGARIRYEIRREFAPYIGVSFARRVFGAADLARARGQEAGQARLMFGIRAWR